MRQEIHDLSHRVIGPQLIEETPNSMTMRDLLDSVISLVKGGEKDVHDHPGHAHGSDQLASCAEPEIAEEIRMRDQEMDKLYSIIAKQYNLIIKDVFFADKMAMQPLEAAGFPAGGKNLERIADHSSRLAINATSSENEPMVQKICQWMQMLSSCWTMP